MEELKKQLEEILKKHAKAMVIEIAEVAAIPALEAAVAKSATPVDDMLLAALKEPLKAELKKLVEAL